MILVSNKVASKPLKLKLLKLPEPIIDQVRMTLDIGKIASEHNVSLIYKANVKENFKAVGNPIMNKEFHSIAVSIKMPVQSHLTSYTGQFAKILVFVDPKDSDKKYILLQFNPSIIDVEHCFTKIRDWLFLAEDKYPGLLLADYCKVTAIHWAIDIRKPIDSLLVHAAQMTYEETVCSSGKTIYLGAKSGIRRFCVYDKTAQLKVKHQKAKPGEYVQPIPKVATSRIEVRLRPKGTLLKDLEETIGNPFKSLTVSSAPIPPDNDTILVLFLVSARTFGANAVYAKVANKSDKKRIHRYMKKYQCYWWKPGDLSPDIANSIKTLIAQIN